MKFTSPTHCIRWYCENLICLCNARSLNVFDEKIFDFKGRKKITNTRIDMLVTVWLYISKLSNTCLFIIDCIHMKNMSNEDIAKLLNKRQNTRYYNSNTVEEIHKKNLSKLKKKLNRAGLIRKGA